MHPKNDTFTRLLVLLGLGLLLFCACSTEAPDPLEIPREETTEVVPVTAGPGADLEKHTFSTLRAAFAAPLLDEHFETLHALANSPVYLNFLSLNFRFHAFKPARPFQTFDAFLDTMPADAERHLLPMLKQHLGAFSAEDIIVLYHHVTLFQSFDIIDNARFWVETPRPLDQEWGRWRRTPTHTDWIRQLGAKRFRAFEKAYKQLAEDTNDTAKETIRHLFDEHGQDAGIIWLAIQAPRTLGFILRAVRDTPLSPDDLLYWVNSEKRFNAP